MILMLAPAPNMTFGAMPSGASYTSDQYALVKVTNNSAADQTALQEAGCYTLTPFGGWGNAVFETLAELYSADASSGLILPGQTGFPQYMAATITDDSGNTGTWAKTGTGSGSGNWTQVSTETFYTAATSASDAEASRKRAQNAVPFMLWTDLAAATGMAGGDRASVSVDDTGTHTDPVVGGTVDNAGLYEYSESPAGWERTGDTDAQKAETAASALVFDGTVGRAATPITGTNVTSGTFVFADPATENRSISQVRAYKGSASAITLVLYRYEMLNGQLSRLNDGNPGSVGHGVNVALASVAGLKTVDVSASALIQYKDEHIGFYNPTTGGITDVTATGDSGGRYSGSGDAATVSGYISTTVQLQIGIDWTAAPVTASGFVTAENEIDALQAAGATDTPQAGGIALADTNKYARFVVRKNEVRHPHIDLIDRRSKNADAIAADMHRDDLMTVGIGALAAINHILLYGQSLSIGYASTPVIHIRNPAPFAKMFQGGVRSRDFTGTGRDALSPLVEAKTGTTPFYGETFATGAALMLDQLMQDHYGFSMNDLNLNFLFSAPGEGSQRADQLADGSAYFTRLKADMAAGVDRAADASGSYMCSAILGAQGEADMNWTTTRTQWKNEWLGIQSAIEAYQMSLTGADIRVPMIFYQNASHTNHSRYPDIPIAMKEMAEENDYVSLAAPMYLWTYTQGEHLVGRDSFRMGGYYGIHLFKWLVQRIKPRHLSYGTPIWLSDGILIPLKDCVGMAAWRTDLVSDPGTYGFTFRNASDVALNTQTPVLRGNTVEIRSTDPLPSTTKLVYGRGVDLALPGNQSGGRGNLADSQGDIIKFRAAGDFPMHNYFPISEIIRA